MRDAFAFMVMIDADEGSQVGFGAHDPSKRRDAYKAYGITVAPLVTGADSDRDPMLAPPSSDPMADLEELRAAMAGKPVNPPTD